MPLSVGETKQIWEANRDGFDKYAILSKVK
jgi:hypothetical protein